MHKLIAVSVFVLLIGWGGYFFLVSSNDYQVEGEISLPILDNPVTVLRDEHGIAYVYAESTRDLIRAQGFVTAQDRLFQMEAHRAIIWGRLAEAIGEAGRESDTKFRLLGLGRNARRHASILGDASRQFLQDYLDGVNAYVNNHTHEHPWEMELVGFRSHPWSIEDALAVLQLINFTTAANMRTELIAQKIVDAVGLERAVSIFPINENPDRSSGPILATKHDQVARLDLQPEDLLFKFFDTGPAVGGGSNNWAVAPSRSQSGRPILVNTPHLDVRVLPGFWHPIGLISPDLRAVGSTLPGVPGILSGRTDRVAYGVTNSYGDVQDLYVERIDPQDPDRYLEGQESFPFERFDETIRIKDDSVPSGYRNHKLTVRKTRRGPVISDHGLGPGKDRVVTLRWSAAEILRPEIGIDKLLMARNATEADRAIQQMDLLLFNFVFADVHGNIGRRASGLVPIRDDGNGTLPHAVSDGSDHWLGWIPKDQMPGEFNPERGWTGSANHDTRPDDYPYYYSSHLSSSYRYRRLKELMEAKDTTGVSDHWRYGRDVRNLQARRLAPQLVRALREGGMSEWAQVLGGWSHDDHPDQSAPLLYQSIYRHLAMRTFSDELGSELASEMLGEWYFWQERFDAMVAAGDSIWFDDTTTRDVGERLEDLILLAAKDAWGELTSQHGGDPSGWHWSNAHRVRFVSPLRISGLGSGLLGGGEYGLGGSGDTLYLSRYHFARPYDVAVLESYRMVADLGDEDKVAAVIPGGVASRQFHDHQRDQIKLWRSGDIVHWWFSDEAIWTAARHRVTLNPD